MDTTTPSPIRPDDTPPAELPDELLAQLGGSDPGQTPVIADRLANELERRLDEVS